MSFLNFLKHNMASTKNKTSVTTISVQSIKVEQSTLTMSEENIMKQIVETHARSDTHIDVKSIFGVADSILTGATHIVDGIATGTKAHVETSEGKSVQAGFSAGFSAPSGILEDISREMGCKALHGESALKATLSLLSRLSSYTWDAKAVLALAAFAVEYGEFWFLTQHTSDQLAKGVAMLKRVPAILNPSGTLKTALVSLNNLVKSVLEISRCIVLIERLSTKHTIKDVPALSIAMSRIPVYAYWSIMTIVYCASQINVLTSMGHEYQAPEISSFSHIITNIYATLQKQLVDINQQIEENRTFQWLLKLHAHPTDNVEIIKALIHTSKGDVQSLVHGPTKQVFKIEDLRRKNVLLHISSVFITRDELETLKRTYLESKKSGKDRQFEIVWIPIVDQWTGEAQKVFESIMAEVPWYTVQRPSLLYETPGGRAAIKFIKHEWHFQNNTVVVSLDSQGKVQHPNAFHMIRIWGFRAFPFVASQEETLWKQETWSTSLLLDGIHPKFPTWVKEGKYIFVYGGNDLKWIQDFEEKAKVVAAEANLSIALLNLGKGTVRKDRDQSFINSFWTRLESLWFSKIHRHSSNEQDGIMQEIQKIVNYNKAGCWAMICRGSKVIVNGHGSVVLSALWQFDAWKKNASSKGFDAALQDYLDLLIQADQGHKCRHFYFPVKAGKIPDHMNCPDCPRNMEKFITFQCCHNDDDVKTIC